MPAKEIKELRQGGKLNEALAMAKGELEDAISKLDLIGEDEPLKELKEIANQAKLIWPKRNISWVFYDLLKQNSLPENFDEFIFWLDEIKNLRLPIEEKMLFENLSWQIGKMSFGLSKLDSVDLQKGIQLFEAIRSIHFPKPTEAYGFLFKALHKTLKQTDRYVEFADWWDFNNFRLEDFQKEEIPNGKEVMAIAEQAYIAYAKHLLPKQNQFGEIVFDKEKALAFLPKLSDIVDAYPQFQYPAYFNAKLLLALGDKNHVLSALLPFAKKKRNDFWVWEVMAEAFSDNSEKVFACYCKALSCKSPEEMLVSLRQKMAGTLISKKLYREAKTEIDQLIKSRNSNGFKIPNEVVNWQSQDWYKTTLPIQSNSGFYKTYLPEAESLLFSDVLEELVIVDFVNSDKKILNFIISEAKLGFFKYDRFFANIKVGDTLKVRFQGGSNEGMHQVYTAIKVDDEEFRKRFIKAVIGKVKILNGQTFGFIDDVFIHPSLINKRNLKNEMEFTGEAIKSFNKERKQWGWKLI